MSLLLLADPAWAGFTLGSYGRVQATAGLEGGGAEQVVVAAHPSRILSTPYLELDLGFDRASEDGATFRAVVTPALSGALFHYDGDFDADLALRNLYVEAGDLPAGPVSAWAGSRMLRGDDVYLLDFWPLDELNTLGGGARYTPADWVLAIHAGLARPSADQYQLQYTEVPEAGGVGTESVLVLDRQRVVGSLEASRSAPLGASTVRAKAYGEVHRLPAGERLVEGGYTEALAADGGVLAGIQLSGWGWENDSFAHVWARVATGLACWDPLAVPEGAEDTDGTVSGAREYLGAVAANHEAGDAAVIVGGYVRRFRDGDADDTDVDDRWEASVAVRPAWHFGEHVQLGVELSHQWLRPDGLNPRTDTLGVPQVTQVAVMPALQPRRGSLARPQVRLQYVYTLLNDDARLWYAEEDARQRSNHFHSLGLGAEWWIDSASYR